MYYLFQWTFIAMAVAGIALRGYRAHYFAVRWSPRVHEEMRYEFGTQTYRGRTLGFLLRFRAPKGISFLLRRETWFDQLAKALHLAAEPQMQDEKFDAYYYVECEDEELLKAARARRDLLKLMTGLQARMGAGGSTLLALRCENGYLDLALKRDVSTGMEQSERQALEWLRPIVIAIRSLPPRDKVPMNRGFVARIGFVAIFLLGTIGATVVSEFFTKRMAGYFSLLYFSLPYSLAALGVILLFTLLWLGRSPARHRVLAACLVVGLPGFVSCGVLASRWLDLSLAQAPPEVIALKKVELFSRHERHDGTIHLIAIHDDDRRTWSLSPIQLSDADYERFSASWGPQAQRPATLLLHPGALGLPWGELVVADLTAEKGDAGN